MTPSPLAVAIGLAIASLSSPVAALTTVDGTTLTIDASTPIDSYRVVNGGTLNATNARTTGITAISSTVNLTGSSVSNSAGRGLMLSANLDPNQPASATLIGSAISGTTAGASAGAFTTLVVSNSQLAGTASNSQGLTLFAGSATVQDNSHVVGGANGVRFSTDAAPAGGPVYTNGTLVVDHAIVEGQTGSAILVNGTALEGANASITIQNQSTLLSGNGTLLEVANNSTAAFTVDNSSLTGDVQVGQGSSAHVNLQNHATLTGQLNNVGQLAVNSGAVWNMVGPASVANIALADGTINLSPDGAAFHRLDIGNLSGNGTFGMRVDLAQLQGDFLNVSGNASGQHGLAIRNTGVEPVKGADPLHVVQIAGGDAKFEAIGNNGMVDAGTFKYVLEQQGNGWYLVQAHDDEGNPIVTPSTQAVLGLFNTAPTIWYGEDASLRSRMGELRFNQSASGAWVRSYGTRVNVDGRAGQPYRHTQYGFTAGADKSIPVATGKLFVGALGGYSRNDLDFGSATTGSIDSFYAGGYATWLGNNGYYVDGVIKGNMFRNDAKVRMSDGSAANGSYTNFGLGASVEFGRQIGLANGWFIEPSARVSAFVSSGATTRLDNGLEAAGSPNKSFQTRIGAALGRNLELANGSTLQPYVKVGLVQEFARGNDVNVNGNRFDSDLAGTRVELGAGVAARVTKTLQLHGDVLYAKGAKLTQPWGVNLGLRYLF